MRNVLLYFGIMLMVYGLSGGSLPAMSMRGGGGGGGGNPPCPGDPCNNGCQEKACSLANCSDVKICGCSAAGGGADCQYCGCDIQRDGSCKCL